MGRGGHSRVGCSDDCDRNSSTALSANERQRKQPISTQKNLTQRSGHPTAQELCEDPDAIARATAAGVIAHVGQLRQGEGVRRGESLQRNTLNLSDLSLSPQESQQQQLSCWLLLAHALTMTGLSGSAPSASSIAVATASSYRNGFCDSCCTLRKILFSTVSTAQTSNVAHVQHPTARKPTRPFGSTSMRPAGQPLAAPPLCPRPCTPQTRRPCPLE